MVLVKIVVLIILFFIMWREFCLFVCYELSGNVFLIFIDSGFFWGRGEWKFKNRWEGYLFFFSKGLLIIVYFM